METFYRTSAYLVSHVYSPVRRALMDEINWSSRLIGIKGSRGVGKTTFLLQYALEKYGPDDRRCLYINMNHFYFYSHSLREFVSQFQQGGGRTLLIDEIFKYPGWCEELKWIYDNYPKVQIIFAGSTVMRLKEANPVLNGIVDSYNLRGFSFREYINLMTGSNFRSYTYDEILNNHVQIATEITQAVKPLNYFKDYIHHGYYPFFLEKKNYSEMLIKNMNTMLEVDILFLKEIELGYLPKLKKLLHILAQEAPCSPNVSMLAKSIETSRATVVNYLSYLKEARLINMLYVNDEQFPKKPAFVYMHNTNILYPICLNEVEPRQLRETFFYNMIHQSNKLNKSTERNVQFLVNKRDRFRVCDWVVRTKNNPEYWYAIDNFEVGHDNVIPLWLFGFLY
ncbi:MAG: AAA family ATPase [Bacteroidales bacterium]|nr:AAA family ATPase [Bacteroidales bacterium]